MDSFQSTPSDSILCFDKEDEPKGYPTTFGQRGIWYVRYSRGVDSAYNEQMVLWISGGFDREILEDCFNTLIERHESLRTVFKQAFSGEVRQYIGKPYSIKINAIAIEESSGDENEEQERVALIATEHGKQPYNLASGHLLRVCLVQLLGERQALIMSFHHLAMDGVSCYNLLRELEILYRAKVNGFPPSLDTLPMRVVDYAEQEERYLSGEDAKESIAYWTDKLSAFPPILELPYDNYWDPDIPPKGDWEAIFLEKDIVREIKRLGKRYGMNVNIVLMSALEVLMMKYTGQADIVIGSPRSNRNHSGLQTLVGHFSNVVLLRNQVLDEISFAELMREVKVASVEASHKYPLPYGKLVEISRNNGRTDPAPLYQVGMEYRPFKLGTSEFPGARIENIEFRNMGDAKFDIMFSFTAGADGFSGHIEYNTELFHRDTIRRLFLHFKALLHSIVNSPEARLDSLNMLPTEERELILNEWNSTTAEFDDTELVHDLLSRTAEKSRDSVAVVYQQQSLTYAQLNARSNQLAHYLIDKGVKPDMLVGLCLERSIELIVCIWGIIKAGGAYLPIDPDYPEDRIDYIVSNSKIHLVLTDSTTAANLNALAQVDKVLIDKDRPRIDKSDIDDPIVAIEPDHLIYCIYTSGSTGKPKGVLIKHSSYLNHMLWMQNCFDISAKDKVLLKTPLSFDASAWEWSLPALLGATLVVAEPSGHRDSDYLLDVIEKEKITVLQAVPSLLKLLLEDSENKKLQNLRYVFCGGEALSPQVCQTFGELGLPGVLCNLYGPTEATIDSTYWICGKDNSISKVPIGRPVDNAKIYILDRHRNIAPIGVIGEIYIGGAGLARGYHNRVDLTKDRFVEDPFHSKHGGRLYKSGDLARYLPDGNIEYMGRADNQIKLRGFRIELGEIENVILAQEGVADAVVVVHTPEQGSEEQYLVAHILLADHNSAIAIEKAIKETLSDLLPHYMVPSFFIFPESLPLLPNGKINRNALPPPSICETGDLEGEAPGTDSEKVLASIWSALLSVPTDSIGIDADFFALGGSSILVMRVASQCKQQGIKLSVKDVYQHRTIRDLARRIDQTQVDPANAFDLNVELDKVAKLPFEGCATNTGSQPRSILLTGATGFVGAYLLREMIRSTDAHIYCLVRCNSALEGNSRIINVLKNYGFYSEDNFYRISVVIGNLAQPKLGMAQHVYDSLSEVIDVIVHNGAWVNHLYPYDVLQPVNVGSTHEVLNLSVTNKLKAVHYVSAITDENGVWENELHEGRKGVLPRFSCGYTMSKWVSEQIINTAARNGLPVSTYRLGMISGDSETGLYNTNDRIFWLINASIAMKCIPDTAGLEKICAPVLTPVDIVAKAIVGLMTTERCTGKTYTVSQTTKVLWGELLNALNNLDYELETVPLADWTSKLRLVANANKDNIALRNAAGLYLVETADSDDALPNDYMDISQDAPSATTLAGLGLESKVIGSEMFEMYLRYLINQGYVEPPEAMVQKNKIAV